ncbi:substrate-binding domain-containing protein [Galactobacter caseinivorans]|uniref:Sugar ABC transporter substrate-binding protein n=1 Tax=Galactobacter caseinivorans TaxID=2676123 RepID=A0A496PG74_9MICC|nr:sugar-binding protein [Galactobacter caseinivorans]RKW69490.1 sugar ABC transporter substrate-binding protein [Galactobacter caseinivorans]
MRRRKLLTAAAAITAAAALALTGCGRAETGATPGSDGGSAAAAFPADAKIGISLPAKTSENWVLAENLFNKDLSAAGFKPSVQFAGDGGAPTQQQQIDAMITSGVKVLVIGAVDGKQLGTQLANAKAQGVTVIAYDRLLQNSKNVDYYIAYDNEKVGELQGQALLDGLKDRKGKGPYNVELIAGSADDANSKPFFEGAMKVLQPKIDDKTLTVSSGQTSQSQVATQGWDPKNVQQRFESILSANYKGGKKLDGVLSPNDTLARAAMLSAKNAGQSTPVITGQDSEKESVKSIAAGVQYSTINKDTTSLVEKTVGMIKDLQAGKDPATTSTANNGTVDVKTLYLDPVLVTEANVKTAYKNDPDLDAIANGK